MAGIIQERLKEAIDKSKQVLEKVDPVVSKYSS